MSWLHSLLPKILLPTFNYLATSSPWLCQSSIIHSTNAAPSPSKYSPGSWIPSQVPPFLLETLLPLVQHPL
ncbi:predicted protein [Plenodomus lingam JN3]|uniref:Predicted protein n=1 Tax=Leptosphaeria maculans (strain JN3 / isolate v23.1.3 / race Av1-4-5-6-7-8) TaxID=985895 RepID=E5A4Y6_LEPMJ|nr:predicted protein [Plenodomus lingam JN3]CBX98684.1 predicted protein [Plenodomus lingam JN3]